MRSRFDEFFVPQTFVLPAKTRLYTPSGAAVLVFPDTVRPFRPVHEQSAMTQSMFTTLFNPTYNTINNTIVELGVYNTDPLPSFPNQPLPLTEPDEYAGNVVDGVLFIHDDGRHQYLNLEAHPKRAGVFVACGEDNTPLHTDKDKQILTDEDGFVLPPRKTLLRNWRDKLENTDGGQLDHQPVTVYDRFGNPIGDFDVVAPNHALTDGRGKRGTRALAITTSVLGACVLIGLIGGILWGRTAVPAEGQITADEATNYHLSQYPVEAAVAFAEHYLTLCFTHPEYTNDVETRNTLMAEMESAGVPENCGWDQGGAIVAVSSIAFNGQVETREEYTKKDGSRVAYLGFFVTLDNGKFYTATVPVWAGRNSQNRPAYSIVGTVGFSAATAVKNNPDMSLEHPVDRQLVSTIEPTLMTFFTAWGKSDALALDAVLTTTATGDVRSGLDGMVTNPSFSTIVVYPSRSPDTINGDTATWNYRNGDTVTAMVSLTWHIPDRSKGYDQPAGYRVTLHYNNGKWEVESLQSGVVVLGNTTTGAHQSDDTGTLGGGFGASTQETPPTQ